MKKLYFSLLLYVAFTQTSIAQVDPHFSQYYTYPQFLNPALTGFMDGDLRINANYRAQWDVASPMFRTIGVAADARTKNNINVGVNVFNLNAGNGIFNTTQAMASIAYDGIRFGKDGMQQVSFGVQVGLINRRLDFTKLQFGDQYSPITGFDPSKATAEPLSNKPTNNVDVSAGILYSNGDPNSKFNPYIGVSAFHLTEPKNAFLNATAGKLPMRLNGSAGIRIQVGDKVALTPHGIGIFQGNAKEVVAGLFGDIQINEQANLMLGVNHRFEDAVIACAGFQYKGLNLAISYDINAAKTTSPFKTGVGEISLTYLFKPKVTTPNRHFACPRL